MKGLYIFMYFSITINNSRIYKSFDCNLPLDVRGTFSDISKALGKISFKELIFKFSTFFINGKLLNLMQDYLRSRQQRVVPNG